MLHYTLALRYGEVQIDTVNSTTEMTVDTYLKRC